MSQKKTSRSYPRGGRAKALRRDAEVTAKARSRRPESKLEERHALELKSTILTAFERS